MAALDRQVTVGKSTLEARLSDIARLGEQVRPDRAARPAGTPGAGGAEARRRRDRATGTEAERRQAAERAAAEQGRLAESARAQVALLTRQIEELRSQLGALTAALDGGGGRRGATRMRRSGSSAVG